MRPAKALLRFWFDWAKKIRDNPGKTVVIDERGIAVEGNAPPDLIIRGHIVETDNWGRLIEKGKVMSAPECNRREGMGRLSVSAGRLYDFWYHNNWKNLEWVYIQATTKNKEIDREFKELIGGVVNEVIVICKSMGLNLQKVIDYSVMKDRSELAGEGAIFSTCRARFCVDHSLFASIMADVCGLMDEKKTKEEIMGSLCGILYKMQDIMSLTYSSTLREVMPEEIKNDKLSLWEVRR